MRFVCFRRSAKVFHWEINVLKVTSRNSLPSTRSGLSVSACALSSKIVFKFGTSIEVEILPQPFFIALLASVTTDFSIADVETVIDVGGAAGVYGCGVAGAVFATGTLFVTATGWLIAGSGSFFFTSDVTADVRLPC